jgi:hypothetical protein
VCAIKKPIIQIKKNVIILGLPLYYNLYVTLKKMFIYRESSREEESGKNKGSPFAAAP